MVRTPRASMPVAAIPVPASTVGRSRRSIRPTAVAPDLDVARSPARNTTAGPVGQPVARSIRRRCPITRGMAAGMSTHLRRTAGAVSASRTGHPPPVDGAVPRISDVPDRITAASPLARASTSVAERSNEAADCDELHPNRRSATSACGPSICHACASPSAIAGRPQRSPGSDPCGGGRSPRSVRLVVGVVRVVRGR